MISFGKVDWKDCREMFWSFSTLVEIFQRDWERERKKRKSVRNRQQGYSETFQNCFYDVANRARRVPNTNTRWKAQVRQACHSVLREFYFSKIVPENAFNDTIYLPRSTKTNTVRDAPGLSNFYETVNRKKILRKSLRNPEALRISRNCYGKAGKSDRCANSTFNRA